MEPCVRLSQDNGLSAVSSTSDWSLVCEGDACVCVCVDCVHEGLCKINLGDRLLGCIYPISPAIDCSGMAKQAD